MDDIFFQIEDNDSNSEEQEIKIQQNPNLIEKIIRERIYESVFYKQHCYTAKLTDLLQKASTGNNCIKYVGTTFGGNTKPTPFICFLFRLLHYPQLSLGAVVYCLDRIGSEYKYVRALFALYLRMTLPTVKAAAAAAAAVEVYKLLEPLYQDYRKLRRRRMDGSFDLIRMDEYIESLLLLNGKEDFPLALPPLTKREVLEEIGQLEKRVSPLQEEYELLLKSQTDSDDSSLSSSSSSSDNDDVTATSNKNKKFKLSFKKKIAPVESTKKDVDHESSFENLTFREEMSIEETNIQRAKLGLPPLK